MILDIGIYVKHNSSHNYIRLIVFSPKQNAIEIEVRIQHRPEHFFFSFPPNRGSVSESTRLVMFSDVLIMAGTVNWAFTDDILTLLSSEAATKASVSLQLSDCQL